MRQAGRLPHYVRGYSPEASGMTSGSDSTKAVTLRR